ncbi:hypothetical protein [Actinoplanes aureus]|uniref:Uncharacterized protein n=1 Tax=Actinoplanes aureus TaxID=2792083 RepID=A0A931CB49_9ACTN|nr:hypothetical protein [Actinoplanes aureus]MBG0561640.1 hypothetical protein [Actinoplanes aureus]
MIPEEDLGPAWLRDYGHTTFGDIEADILAMEEFAARLKADVEQNYAPRAVQVSDTMLTALPPAHEGFLELQFFRAAHERAQDVALQNVYNYANGTYGFATAAREVSEKYRGADAYARARVTDVHAGLRTAGILPTTEEP